MKCWHFFQTKRNGGWNFCFSLLKHVEDFRVNVLLEKKIWRGILIMIKTKFLCLLLIFIREDKGYLLSHECLAVSVHQFFQPPMLVFC